MFDKKESCHHGILGLIIAVLLGLILLVLVFKVGLIVGKSNSYSSYYKKGHIAGKLGGWGKTSHSAFKVVVKLTDSGFVVKGSDGEEQEVITNEDTVIIKGAVKTGNTVSVGDKVYITGSIAEASMVKIFDFEAVRFKK